MTTLHLTKSIARSPLRLGLPCVQPMWVIRGFLLIAFAGFGLSPIAQAVLPAPDGGYSGNNTAEGNNALFSITTGTNDTAIGNFALHNNTSGIGNTATGAGALESNTTGLQNTANGNGALTHNTTGSKNTANGNGALYNSNGSANTANGNSALTTNTTGVGNTADGSGALKSNTTGSENIALGNDAGQSLTTGSNNIDIGALGIAGESDKIRIGTVGTQNATFIAGIHGVGVTGTAVVVSAAGQLGVAPSSARFKDEIKPMEKTSEAILALKPVTFRYKKELDPDGIPQFGLVAEDVAKVNADLVARDAKSEVYTVRYDAVNAMMLNEFLKEHKKVQEQNGKIQQQEATIAELKSTVAQQRKYFQATAAHQQKQIEALTMGLQKVSAQLEASKPAPQVVTNP